MLAALFTSRAAKPLLIAGAFVLVLLLAGLGFWRGFAVIERLQDKAVKAAVALRDAEWKGQIDAANAKAASAREAQAVKADAASRAAAAEISRLSDSLAEKEARNAALPNADACGLDHDRVRLLNQGR
nr:hypothetical protein [Methylobacterium sp. ZNC0032]